MISAILKRVSMGVITLLGVAIVVFILLRVAPGNPIAMMIGPGASESDILALKAKYGLDQSLPMQFWIWLTNFLQGDFGTSISRQVSVISLLAERLPATLELAVAALIIAVLLGGVMAVASTLLRKSWGASALDGANSLLLTVPEFVWALAFVLLLGVAFPILPLSGRNDPAAGTVFVTNFYLIEALVTGRWGVAWDVFSHMLMPVFALALPLAAIIARVLKEALGEAMMQDYVVLAQVKGMNERRLVLGEALRNAVGPTLALTGVQFTFLIGGTVIIEKIFSYPGLGNMAIDAVINRDFPLIQGLILMFGVLFILINLAVDLLVVALNPRLSRG